MRFDNHRVVITAASTATSGEPWHSSSQTSVRRSFSPHAASLPQSVSATRFGTEGIIRSMPSPAT